jgi:hypothetical protein
MAGLAIWSKLDIAHRAWKIPPDFHSRLAERCARLILVKKLIALVLLVLSGLDLLLPDPLIFSEVISLPIFLWAVSELGFDVTKYVPFLRKFRRRPLEPGKKNGPVVDV